MSHRWVEAQAPGSRVSSQSTCRRRDTVWKLWHNCKLNNKILTATLATKNRWSKNSPSAVHSKERRRRTCPGRKITAARRRWRGGILPRSWFHNPDGREMYLTEKFSDVLPAEEGEAGHVQACCYQSWFRQIVKIHLHQWILCCRHCLSHRQYASTDVERPRGC